MSLLLILAIFTGVDLYFLKDSPDLLVRVIPEVQTECLTLFYSFSGTDWDSVVVEKKGKLFDAVLKSPDTLDVVGIYYVYDNGDVDDNNGELYLYELKKSPRMLMPFSMTDLEVMIGQAKKKITSGVHVDEAVTLLNYIDGILAIIPVLKNSPGEFKKNTLRVEVDTLRNQITK